MKSRMKRLFLTCLKIVDVDIKKNVVGNADDIPNYDYN
jgi:hypothetical protein